MKKALLLIINFYQLLISTLIKNIFGIRRMCRYSPSCSEYAKMTIKKEGVLVGMEKTIARILSCHSFSKN